MEQRTQHTRLYAVLELTPTASKEDIRKAFRQLSLRWHPDKHPEESKTEATERFREVAEAYEVLHDESKRTIYDQYGEAGLKGEVPVQDERGYHYEHFEHHSPFDIFREFFANDPWMAQFFQQSGSPFQHSSFHSSSGGGRNRQSHTTQSMHHPMHGFFGSSFGSPFGFADSPFHSVHDTSIFNQDPFFQMSSALHSSHRQLHHHHQQQHHHHHQHEHHYHQHQLPQRSRSHRQQTQLTPSNSNQSVTRITFSDDDHGYASSNGHPTVVSTRQSTQIINGQRTTVTTTFKSDGTETTIVEGPDGSRQTTVTQSQSMHMYSR